jgi:hypothetical protein
MKKKNKKNRKKSSHKTTNMANGDAVLNILINHTLT